MILWSGYRKDWESGL